MTAYLPRDDAVTYRRFVASQKRLEASRRAVRKPAEEKARALLREFLGYRESVIWDARDWFMIKAFDGGHRYMLIDYQHSPVIIRMETCADGMNRARRGYCFHAPEKENWPVADQLLTYLLWIKDDWEKFEWHANSHLIHVSWMRWVRDEIMNASDMTEIGDACMSLMKSPNPSDRLRGLRIWTSYWLKWANGQPLGWKGVIDRA